MRFIRRDPDHGYLDSWLWLPKKHVSLQQIASSLSYFDRKERSVCAWREETFHYRVPRNFFSPQALTQLSFPIYDARFKDFPHVPFRSRVKLDVREPSQTYQREGSAALLDTYDGILCLRCGAGKTIVGLHAAAQLQQPILIVVNDKGLARQWLGEIESVLGIPESQVGRIGGDDGAFDWRRPICIAIVNSLALRSIERRLPPQLAQHFGVILLDEAHVMGAPFFNQAIPPLHGRRWGLSATPNRLDGYDSLLKYTVGEVVYSYLLPDLRPTVFFRQLNTRFNPADPVTRKGMFDCTGEFHFTKAAGHFATLDDRVGVIVQGVRNAVAKGRQVLVLSSAREMVERLHRELPGSGVCHGDIAERVRERNIQDHNPVVCIQRLGRQALNKPSLDTLVVCDPFTDPNLLQQAMGRVLRKSSGKSAPHVIFYEDIHIEPLRRACQKIRKTLNRWPENKGGRIEYRLIRP